MNYQRPNSSFTAAPTVLLYIQGPKVHAKVTAHMAMLFHLLMP
jgi:hypothetical protein